MSKKKFFENEEVQGIIKIIFGQDYKRGFTVEDAKISKVIFMADADVDGAHISALLLRFFVMYLPFLIEAGMIYKAIPPLYSINTGKVKVKDERTGKTVSRPKKRYFTEQIDIVRYIQKLFLKDYNVTDLKGNPVSSKDITVFFMKNVDYIYYLVDNLANTYMVNPELLEMVLYHYIINKDKINITKLQKEIKSKFRFMDVIKENGTIVIKGTIDKSNLIIFNDKFLEDSRIVLDLIRDNKELYYILNGQKMSIYQIMNIYSNMSPSGVQRYKGLGEMEDWELAESTLYPGSDRTLVRYTMQDALEEINAIREYESDTKKILSLIGTISREDLLD